MGPVPRSRRLSLAAVSGRATSVVVSTLIVASHILFGYAQLSGIDSDCPGIGSKQATCPLDAPNDGLVEVLVRGSVKYEAHGLLANTLGVMESRVCGSACPPEPSRLRTGTTSSLCSALSCDTCAAVGELGLRQHCTLSIEESVMHLSYVYMCAASSISRTEPLLSCSSQRRRLARRSWRAAR